jgi:hypothetical protein
LPTLIIGPLTRKRPQPHELTLLGPPGDLFTQPTSQFFKVYASTAQRRSISSAAIVGE